MSTTLIDEKGVVLTRFYGGFKRGVMLQITVDGVDNTDYIQITPEQVRMLIERLPTALRMLEAK